MTDVQALIHRKFNQALLGAPRPHAARPMKSGVEMRLGGTLVNRLLKRKSREYTLEDVCSHSCKSGHCRGHDECILPSNFANTIFVQLAPSTEKRGENSRKEESRKPFFRRASAAAETSKLD